MADPSGTAQTVRTDTIIATADVRAGEPVSACGGSAGGGTGDSCPICSDPHCPGSEGQGCSSVAGALADAAAAHKALDREVAELRERNGIKGGGRR